MNGAARAPRPGAGPAPARAAGGDLTRRRLLGLAGVALAGGACGSWRGARSPRIASEPRFDVCVIGSGFAGTFLALKLVERGVRTALVEAGGYLSPDDPPEGASSILPVAVHGDTGLTIDALRTIGVGGTSRRWSGVASRLSPDDFRVRSRFGALTDWPIDYGELEPYYCDAERALGVAGDEAVPGAEPQRSCGLPFRLPRPAPPELAAGGEPLRFVRVPFASRAGERRPVRLAEIELPRFESSPLGTLLARSPARRLLTDGRGRALAVEVRAGDESPRTVHAGAFVVAAGCPESARLLLASRPAEAPSGLGNRHGAVGRFFHAHPRLRLRIADPASVPRPILRSYSIASVLRREGLGAAHVDLHRGAGETILEMMPEMEPRQANRFSLDGGSPDAAGRLDVSWSAFDRRTLGRVGRLQRELAARLAPGASTSAAPFAWFHPAGVCRMARRAEEGVVDRDGRVFGTSNVFVAGAAVFPVSGSGNPTLTIVALALRLADHLTAFTTETGR